MECFTPGAQYGFSYRFYIWVCVNPVDRSFDKCALVESRLVLEAFRQEIQRQGLSNQGFVFQSGCLLGCQAEGTTVAIARVSGASETGGAPLTFYQNVKVTDVAPLIASHLLS